MRWVGHLSKISLTSKKLGVGMAIYSSRSYVKVIEYPMNWKSHLFIKEFEKFWRTNFDIFQNRSPFHTMQLTWIPVTQRRFHRLKV